VSALFSISFGRDFFYKHKIKISLEVLQKCKAREGRIGEVFFQGYQDYAGHLQRLFEQKSKQKTRDFDTRYSLSITLLFQFEKRSNAFVFLEEPKIKRDD